MKILVIGSGGREHALCWKFAQSSRVAKVFCANGNAGISQVAECIAVSPTDISGLVNFAAENAIDLTFVGGETSLALGIVDEFQKKGLQIIGPSKAAAMLESSKAFAKDLMARHGVPTAKYTIAHSPAFARLELDSGDLGGENSPVVVKADGLAAGKGVVVAANRREAESAIEALADLVGDDAAEKIVLEECLFGKEISLLCFVDGENYALMPPVRDHKRIGEGDTGPNTGGMGTFTDDTLLSSEMLQNIEQTIIKPTLKGCVSEGIGFKGILFIGLMMTAEGPKVLEYNIRFGDPETQSIMVRLETDLFDVCEAMLSGDLSSLPIKWSSGNSACVILAAENYPAKPKTGDIINGIEAAEKLENVTIFHSGTSLDAAGNYIVSGGRVLGVTAIGSDLSKSLGKAYSAVEKISWQGMQFRRDIGSTIK